MGIASDALEQRVSGVKEVSCQLRDISTSTAQQSVGLQEVQRGVGNPSDITRENSALVEEPTTAAHALLRRAQGLREAVVQVQVRQGSTEDAKAMVQRALEHVEAAGITQALADFKLEDGRFIDRVRTSLSMTAWACAWPPAATWTWWAARQARSLGGGVYRNQ